MSYLIENEQTKLLASALDRISTGLIVVGVLSPYAAVMFGTTIAATHDELLLSTLSWFAAGVVVHIRARWVLQRLQE
jgi:hypothetical protein